MKFVADVDGKALMLNDQVRVWERFGKRETVQGEVVGFEGTQVVVQLVDGRTVRRSGRQVIKA